MAELITLTEDGPLGKAGARVWVNDPPAKPAKRAAKTDGKSDSDDE